MSKERQSLRQLIMTLSLAVIVLLLLLGPAVYAQGIPKSFFDWAIIKKLTVTTGGADFQSDVTMDNVTLSGTLDMGGGIITDVATLNVTDVVSQSTNLDLTGAITSSTATITSATFTTATVTSGDISSLTATTVTITHIADRAAMLRIQDALVANEYTNILAAINVPTTTTSITSSSLTQPDYPRNLVISYTTTTTATTGTLTVAGVDARGSSTSEELTVSAISGTQTITGSVPWAVITSLTLPTQTEELSASIGTGNALGLPIVPTASSDVFMVTKNNVYTTAYTVDTTYGAVAPTVDVAANDDFSIWFKQ
jgi:hypothetical protein